MDKIDWTHVLLKRVQYFTPINQHKITNNISIIKMIKYTIVKMIMPFSTILWSFNSTCY